MLQSGVPIHVVARQLGDKPETILAWYADVLPGAQREAAERLEFALLGTK